jgi:hypothetical protein
MPRPSARRCWPPAGPTKRHLLALPAYDQCIKASHIFNLLDARGVISVTERQAYILRVRELAKGCCEAWGRTAGGGVKAVAPTQPLLARRTQAVARLPPPPRWGRAGVGAVAMGMPMPELLLELFSEEIPARMQARAAADLKALVTGGLVEAGLTYEGAQSHAGPRRLVLSVEGLAGVTPEVTEERKGPRVDAPAPAIEGFLRSAGVRLEDCAQVEDKKGRFFVARITRPGRPTPDVVAELVPDVIRRFPWPKSMRWGSGACAG